LKQGLITFANCLSEVFASSRVSLLNNFPIRTYLPLLKLESLRKLYESIQEASNPQRRRLNPEIPNLVADEIVFRTLVKIPRDFAPLKEFLAASFPEDRLLDAVPRILPFEIPPLYPRLKDLLDFDLAYLDALKSLLEVPTHFTDAIKKALSRFANESYFVNLLFAVDKDFTDDEVSPETRQIIKEHFLNGFVRQVVTDRQKAWAEVIFDESSQVGKLFLTTARRAQAVMGDYLGKLDFIRYQFVEDEQTPLFFHEGSSGGLAFAELYYLAQTSLHSPLAPYTAFLGAINEKQEIEAMANIEAKIEAAKENGLRILILPERNREQVHLDEEPTPTSPTHPRPLQGGEWKEGTEENFQFLSYKEGVFSDVFSQIESFHKEHGFLPPNNLPERRNRFIGREGEISAIREFLKKERLVILTGTGGVGKTRLAEQVALEFLPGFPDGVWFVDLPSIRDADLVLPTIASALSIQPQLKIPLKQQMIDLLKTKRLLFVLDNFEQLPHKAGELIEELIQNTDFVRCLVTSRDVSTCPYGKEFWVAPLDTPKSEAKLFASLTNAKGLWLIDSVDSVKLFLCRAEELGQPISEEDLPTVAELCRTIDGIPLAIELAAARLTDFSPTEILSRIKNRLPLQVDESTDTFDPRHQKLQSVLSWSYDLLTEAEQELFPQLSVFSGGFFTEAVENICTGKNMPGNLFSLRAKSLVQTETIQQKKRYFLLESIRQYAREKLGDGEQIKKSHAEYFGNWAKELDEKLSSDKQTQSLDTMALELDNFRTAIDFAKEQKEWKLLGELGVALRSFFEIRGLWPEGIICLEQAEAALRRLQEHALLAKVVHGLGIFYHYQGNFETARKLHNESLKIKRELGDREGIASSLNNLGLIAWLQAKFNEARQLLTESLQIRKELGNKLAIAGMLNNLGNIEEHQGAYEKAQKLFTESLQIYEEHGSKGGIAMSLSNLGIIAGQQGDYAKAKQIFTECLKIDRELGNKRSIFLALNNLGDVARLQGNYEEARQFCTESLKIARELENKQGIALVLNNLGEIAENQGAYEEAIRLYTETLGISRELEDKRLIANLLGNLGQIAMHQGAYDETRQLFTESLQIKREIQEKPGIAKSLHHFGKLARAEGDSARAALFLFHASRLYEEMEAANSKDAKEINETLTGLQKEIGIEQFERLNRQAETMSMEQVVKLALA